jgi:hypothetical protein
MTFSSRRVKEEDSNDKTWGKGSGSSRRYIRHEESTNGSSTRWLASGERSGWLTSVGGGVTKRVGGGRSVGHRGFYSWRRERELVTDPHIARQQRRAVRRARALSWGHRQAGPWSV